MPNQFQMIIAVKLWCPYCGVRHVDETRNGERWDRRAHTTHRCQGCGKDFDVYASGAPDEIQPEPSLTLKQPLTWPTCGCLISKHANHENYASGPAERDARVCKLGWPL